MNINWKIIQGDTFEDNRGRLSFVNQFSMIDVKRMYLIEHFDTKTIRAWQGHKIENKWFYVLEGSFKIVLVKPDDWEFPSLNLITEENILRKGDNRVLYVPGGYANGFCALAPGSKLLVFSNLDLEEAKKDNFRFDSNLWFDWDSNKWA